ncbi:MAG: hypothetical protein ABGW82_03865, partial [Paracoccus sp. (in: a-proteobacteria)]
MADEKGNSDRDGPDPASGSAQLLRLADYDRVQPGHIIAEMRDYWHGLRRGRAAAGDSFWGSRLGAQPPLAPAPACT